MTNKKKSTIKNDNFQGYAGAGVAFFVTGTVLFITEGTRASSLPFLVLGATFITLGYLKRKKIL